MFKSFDKEAILSGMGSILEIFPDTNDMAFKTETFEDPWVLAWGMVGKSFRTAIDGYNNEQRKN